MNFMIHLMHLKTTMMIGTLLRHTMLAKRTAVMHVQMNVTPLRIARQKLHAEKIKLSSVKLMNED